MAKKKPAKTSVESLKHKDKRKNIPTAELQNFVKEDEAKPKKILYPRDPSLDPSLSGKARMSRTRKTWKSLLFPSIFRKRFIRRY